MESFDIIRPSLLLAPYIRHYWILKTEGQSQVSERIIPTGYLSLVFHRSNRMFSSKSNDLQPRSFICGLNTDYSDLEAAGDVNMICVVFNSYATKAFFNLPLDEFSSEISVCDAEDKALIELEKQIQDTAEDRKCIQFIERYLINRLYLNLDNSYNYDRIGKAVEIINSQGQTNLRSLADSVCLSYKQFQRVFTEHIGTNPKEFSRIVRFQRALHILQTHSQISFAQLAYECGYYDQPHLIKDFKTMSGYTPGEYIAFCSPYSDYFSQP